MADQQYQSLYRRFRPQRFSELRGQDHVVAALTNAVRRGQVAHAYLFSGARGTGKTSTARILAKALNCEAVTDGEPCGVCDSCVGVARGSSLDVHELDAASNNGVDAMRDLVSRAALGTPGRHKVYIVDEVHMLSPAASNALLKTLEEPPAHVVFVLATTDPHKVLPTIRSRTQHFEFHLLGPEVLQSLLSDVERAAGLDLAPGVVERAVRRAGGSARDALSALDQLAATGGTGPEQGPGPDAADAADSLLEALAQHDAGQAIVALARAAHSGSDPERVATELVAQLREGFLALMAPELVGLVGPARERVSTLAKSLGPAAVVRAIETLGQALVDMRDALDPRTTLEAALARLAHPEADISPAALLARLEALERRSAGTTQGASIEQAGTRQSPVAPVRAAGRGPAGGAPEGNAGEATQAARPAGPALGAIRQQLREAPARRAGAPLDPEHETPSVTTPPAAGEGHARPWPTRDDLVQAWGDHVLGGLRPRARSLFRAGRFVAAAGGVATFALPDAVHRANSEPCRADVEAALSSYFGVPIRLELVVDETPGKPPPAPAPQRAGEPTGQAAAASAAGSPFEEDVPGPSVTDRVLEVFPGAVEVQGG